MSFKKNINDIKKNYSLGIIGGGQLALMLTEAAKKRDLEVCVQTKSCDDPAGLKADHVIEADPLKIRGNKSLINECEKIIFENEWIKIDKLNLIGNSDIFVPSLNAIKPLVDRFSQKKLIDRMNIPCPKWISIEDFKNLSDEEIKNWTFPLMAKSNKGGYDGKGNKKIKTKEDLDSFLTENSSDEWLIEEWIEYKKELALVGSRDRTGKIRFFPIVETFQSNHVCDWVLAPGTNEYDLNLFAINIFSSIVNELNYVGVLEIKFFYEGTIMINLLGLKKNFPISMETRIKMLSEIEGSNIHCYGKSREILGRKMAHITFLLNGKTHSERYDEAQILLTMVRDIWPSPNA